MNSIFFCPSGHNKNNNVYVYHKTNINKITFLNIFKIFSLFIYRYSIKKVLKNVNEKTSICIDILPICKELRKNFQLSLQKN